MPDSSRGETRQSLPFGETVKSTQNLEDTQPGRTPKSVYAVGVYGATGYTGQVLMSLLASHPNARIVFATSESSKESADGMELVPVTEAPLNSAEVVFLCLPHGASGSLAAKAVAAGVRVIEPGRLRAPNGRDFRHSCGRPPGAPGCLTQRGTAATRPCPY